MESNVATPDNIESAEGITPEMRGPTSARLNEMIAKTLRLEEELKRAIERVITPDRTARPELPDAHPPVEDALNSAEEFKVEMRGPTSARFNEMIAKTLILIEELKRAITPYPAARDQFPAAHPPYSSFEAEAEAAALIAAARAGTDSDIDSITPDLLSELSLLES